MPSPSVFGSYIEGPFHGLAFDGGTFHLGILSDAAITIGGVPVHTRVRKAGLTIHDVLNDAPNTCTLVMEGDGPAVGQSLRITINEGRVLFAGQVQTVDQAFESKPEHVAWAVTAIDDTAKANYRRPFGTFVDTSATTIAQAISATYAPSFSTAGIAAALPNVSIVFDGADTFIAALVRLATAIGGYAKVEDGVIYLFLEDLTAAPDPIDETHRFLHTPAIQANVDSSQLRTRVYGKGYGEHVRADLAIGESLVPIQDGVTFPAYGGLAILATTADGAQSEKVAYTGVALAGGGTLVGPGAGPTMAPGVSLAAGAGIESGVHEYALVFVTALGKSLPGPRVPITVGAVPAPGSAPLAGVPISGTGPDQGSHDYAVAFVTSFGETVAGPISNAVTTSATVGELAPPGATYVGLAQAGAGCDDGYHDYVTTLVNANGETTPGGPSVQVLAQSPNNQIPVTLIPTGPAGTTARKLYRRYGAGGTGGAWKFLVTIPDNTTTTYLDTKPSTAVGADAPTGNTTGTAVQRVPVSNIPLGPAGITARKLYRRFNGAGTFKLVTTIANNTGTTFTDTLANSGLGANALTTSTAVGNRVTVTWPAGPTAVTDIEVYRTQAGLTPLYRTHVVGSNTAGSVIDVTADAFLGATAPISDTSGLRQPEGQVNPGSTVLPVAAAATFRAGGGWVILGGGQVVRYAAVSAQTLTGIPATGAGAISTTVLYGQQAIPAPMLLGVTGIVKPILKGAAVHIWVQRDDTLAQAEQAARAGGDGIIEYLLTDERRGQDSLIDRCDADLALFSRPIVTVSYATRDLKTKSGKQVVIDLDSPRISETLTIQDVTITEIDIAAGLAPRFMVRASSVRFSLEDTLRRLIAGGSIVGGSS
jgi:hypothetical protein